MDRFTDEAITEEVERLELQTELCETANLISSVLRSEREPDEHFIEFDIDEKSLMAYKDLLPAEITGLMGEIVSVSLEFRYTNPEDSPAICLMISDVNGNVSLCKRTANSPREEQFSQRMVLADMPFKAEDLPANAFNQFIANLIYPSKEKDFSQFDQADLYGVYAAKSLIDSLRKRQEAHEESEYKIPALGCIVLAAGAEERLDRLTVAYTLPRSDVDDTLRSGGIEAGIEPTSIFSLITMEKIDDVSNPKQRDEFIPTLHDYKVLKSVLEEILSTCGGVQEVSLERLQDIEGSDSPADVQRRIAQLYENGFDSPDTGA